MRPGRTVQTLSTGTDMSTWRRKALEALPEERKLIESSDNPMALWIELFLIFEKLVEMNEKEKIREILNYAAWCFSEKSGKIPNDTSTAVACSFYEVIASHKKYWPLFREWFFPHEFENIKACFKYHLNEDEFKELEITYYKKA